MSNNPVDASVVDYVAELARLDLDDATRTRLVADLQKILGHVAMLNRVEVEGVPITSHPLDQTDVDRPDTAAPSLGPDQALCNAPDRDGALFRVPAILGGSGDDAGGGA